MARLFKSVFNKKASIPEFDQQRHEVLNQYRQMIIEQMKSSFVHYASKARKGYIRLDRIEPLLRHRIEEELNSLTQACPKKIRQHQLEKERLLTQATQGVKLERSALNFLVNSAFLDSDFRSKTDLINALTSKMMQTLNLPIHRLN